jgi:hypothetical protein
MINWEYDIEEYEYNKKNILICRNLNFNYAGFLNYDNENELIFNFPNKKTNYSFNFYFNNVDHLNINIKIDITHKMYSLSELKEKYNVHILGVDIDKNDILNNKEKYVNFFKE